MTPAFELLNNVKDLFGHHVIFGTGILLMTGYFFGRIAELLKLPSITGYILAGLLLGESVIGIIPATAPYKLTSITEIALGLIAITIGAEFEISRLRRTGRTIMIITIFQAVFALVFVFTGLVCMKMEMSYALILGAIATATAPAATVVIVKELRARGEFVDYLYGVVALDDAVCVILFSIIFALVAPGLAGTIAGHESGIMSSITRAGLEILFSCLLGAVSGFLLHEFTRKKYRLNEILIISIAIIFLTISIAIVLNLSLLISNMMMGAVLVNLSHRNKRIFRVIEPITPPLFALFFVLAGTELHLYVFTKLAVILFGLMYILARFAGKYMGTWISAYLTKTSTGIRNYLGFCLFPQAGVAIGLVLFVQTSPVMLNAPEIVREMMVLIVNIVLFSIFINELIGPLISKFGLVRGAELE
ncbi:MAG: cation:proton antiporter [Candidatus Marinimicrobia bacterium]|nr:cation:proton antiporter [Candidatus Neomarinimicrobiota bacterium]